MKLQEIFDQLATGEFSQLSIGGAAAGVIDATNWKSVVNHLNLGLTSLYSRFSLKEEQMALPLLEGVEGYALAPAGDDLLKVMAVKTLSGCDLPLNDASDETSVMTPSQKKLRVPLDTMTRTKSNSLVVTYRAGLPRIVVDVGFDPATVEVELPVTHLLPLLYFVASRVNNPIGMSNEFHAGNSYWAKYEKACMDLEDAGLEVDQGSQNTRLYRGGWV
jgi:hypothetical protein